MDVKTAIEAIFDKHEVWTISISCRPEIIDEIVELIDQNTIRELTFDEAEALGLDGTLRTTDGKPYRIVY